MVPKPNGTWRPCGDYRVLNKHTIPDQYSIPNIHDFVVQLDGTSIYSKNNLIRAYHQIPINLAEILKTVICTTFRLFEYITFPFGEKCQFGVPELIILEPKISLKGIESLKERVAALKKYL